MHATACNFLQRRARIRFYKSSSCRKISSRLFAHGGEFSLGEGIPTITIIWVPPAHCPSAISVVAPRNSPQLAPCSCSPTQGVRAEFSKALTVAFVSKFPLMVLRTVL